MNDKKRLTKGKEERGWKIKGSKDKDGMNKK